MDGHRLGELTLPFYLFDLDRLAEKYAAIEGAFRSHFSSLIIGYSYKTNYLPAFCRLAHELGAHAEVVSMVEYRLARTLGVPGERIIYNGPAKTREDLEIALREGARVHLDSMAEVEHVVRLARQGRRPLRVGLRVRMPLEEPGRFSRFGLATEEGELDAAFHLLERTPAVRVTGLHAHLSTRSRSLDRFRRLATLLARAAGEVGLDRLETLDVGGGFGFAPAGMRGLAFPSFAEYAALLREVFDLELPGLADRVLVIEPGIALVGDCASLFARVHAIKAGETRPLLVTDASVHTVKPSRHRHNHPIEVLDEQLRPRRGPLQAYDVVGYTCMEDDYVATDVEIPRCEVGDVLRIDNVGAYSFVFKPPFIRGLPACYVTSKGRLSLARSAEEADDWIRRDVL
jgi:diaminopimelate decarboxylase